MKGAHYVETSAVLRILLEGDRLLAGQLARAKKRVTSALTETEARGLLRAASELRIDERRRRESLRVLRALLRSCDVMAVGPEVLDRAGQAFPVEPVRTLDAIHLASALLWEESIGSIVMVSCDDRVRDNAKALGLKLLPA